MTVIKLQPQRIPGVKRIIGVISGKGGVGKTFITTNLALACAKNGLKVGALDADINYPNLFHFFGISARVNPNHENKLTPPEKFGVKVMSMAGMLDKQEDATMWRGTIMSKIIQQLSKETMWGELDILFVDFATGLSDHIIHLLQTLYFDGMLMVTTPDQTALNSSRRVFTALNLLDIPVLSLVENMRGEVFGEGATQRLAEFFQIPLIASIPLRRNFCHGGETGKPPVLESDELTIVMNKLSRFIVEKTLTAQAIIGNN